MSVLALSRRVVMAKRGEIFGSWDADWTYIWTELKEDTPKKTSKGIEIILKVSGGKGERERKYSTCKCSLFVVESVCKTEKVMGVAVRPPCGRKSSVGSFSGVV